MSIGRIGGTLFVVGNLLFVVVVAIAAGGGAVGIGLRDVDGRPVVDLGVLVGTAALILAGSGAAVLGVAGPRPLSGLDTRAGLGTLAIGLFSLLALSVLTLVFALDADLGWPAALLIVGLVATVCGPLVTGLSLVRAPGRSRGVGAMFFGGFVLLLLREILRPYVGEAHWVDALAVLGWVGIFLSAVAVGVLAINGGRSARLTSA